MTPPITDSDELRCGFEALVDALGWVNAVRFIQQYEAGEGNYTRERDEVLPNWDVDRLLQESDAITKR